MFKSNSNRILYFIFLVFSLLNASNNVLSSSIDNSRTSFGCTDESACNYNPYAEEDDGSCAYVEDCLGVCGGDAEVDECNVCDSNSNNNNLSCMGCTNPLALNYNPNILIDDGSCNYDQPDQQWNYSYGNNEYEMPSSLKPTIDGGYIIAGYRGEFEESDFYLLKINSEGILEWERTFGGNNREIAFSVLQTEEDDGYIIVGYTRSYGAGNNDIWIVKTDEYGYTCDYSSNGNCYSGTSMWATTIGNGQNQIGRSIVEFSDNGELKYAVLSQEENNNNTDIGLYLLSTNGNEEQNRSYGWNQTDIGYSLKKVDDGFIIVGYTNSYGHGSPGDVWIIKTDFNGNTCVLDNNSYNDLCLSEDYTDVNGNGLYDVGEPYFDADGNGQWDGDEDEQCNGNCHNNEDNTWSRTFGGLGTDYGLSVDLNFDGSGYIVTGSTNSFSNDNFDLWMIKTDLFGNTCNYNFIEEYYDFNNNGEYDQDESFIDVNLNNIRDNDFGNCYSNTNQWVNYFGGENDDVGRSIQATLDGGYIVAGETNTDSNEEDAWIIKTTSLGRKYWDYSLNGQKKDIAKSILVEPNGYIFAGGSISFSENEKMDITLTKLETDDCSYLGNNAIKDECGICCNCKTIEDFTDSNGNGYYDIGEPYVDFNLDGQHNNDTDCEDLIECSFYRTPNEGGYGGQYDCNGDCFGGAITDDDLTYGDGEPFTDTNDNGQYDFGEPFTECNWNLTICDDDEGWIEDMNETPGWNTNPLDHCCENIYRDDCGECYGDNVGCAEIIINEIMNNPEIVIDSKGEWFELYNNEENPISLRDWKITDGHTTPEDEFFIDEDLIIPPKGYIVLGNNADFSTNGGINIDYEYSNIDFSLFNGPDEILLQSQKTGGRWTIRDSVSWADNDYNQSGFSQSLINAENFQEYCSLNNEDIIYNSKYDCDQACQNSNNCNQNEGAWVTLSKYNDLEDSWTIASRINGNGIWDENELFYDCDTLVVNNADVVICENDNSWNEIYGNDQYDFGEPFFDEIENGDKNSNGKPNFDSELIFTDYFCIGPDDCNTYYLEEECPDYCDWLIVDDELNFPNVMVSNKAISSFSIANDGYGELIVNNIQLNSDYYNTDKIFNLESCALENDEDICGSFETMEDCIIENSCYWEDMSEIYDDTNNNGMWDDHELCEDVNNNGLCDQLGACNYNCNQSEHYLDQNQSLIMEISFNPKEVKSYVGLLIIQTNDFENQFIEIPIYGQGIGMSSLVQTDDTLYFNITDIDNCIGCSANLNIENIGVETLEIEELGLFYGNLFSESVDYIIIEPNNSENINVDFSFPINIIEGDNTFEKVLDCVPFQNEYVCEGEGDYDFNGNGIYDEADLNWNSLKGPEFYDDNVWDPGDVFLDCGLDNTCNQDEDGYDSNINIDPNNDDYHPDTNPNGTENNGLWDCVGDNCLQGSYYDKLFIYSNEPGNISEVTLIASIDPTQSFDLNNDNKSDILDIIQIVDVALGFSQSDIGDFNYDGLINVIDISILIEFILVN